MRLQLALNVRNLDEAVAYYSGLFDVKPHKRRDGYANFAVDDPPLKLVLFENPGADHRLHHLGVEILDAHGVERTLLRLSDAGLVDKVERDETCCHAVQDKIWSREPQGLPWEWYRITQDHVAADRDSLGKTCCTGKDGRDTMTAD